jgi:hypothetical protein
MNQHDGMQHVASLSLNQYNYLALKYGFMEAEYGIVRKIKGYSPIHNRKDLLLGRLLFMVFSK